MKFIPAWFTFRWRYIPLRSHAMLGMLRRDDALLTAGRRLMSAAAISAAVADLAGFAAQEGVLVKKMRTICLSLTEM
jgi:hypothetical protein